MLMTPLYTARSTVEIQREGANIVNVQSVESENEQPRRGILPDPIQPAEGPLAGRAGGAEPAALRGSGLPVGLRARRRHAGRLDDRPAGADPAQRDARIRQVSDVLLKNVGVAPIRQSRLVEVTLHQPRPAALGAHRRRLDPPFHRAGARAAVRGDLLCAALPRGAARPARAAGSRPPSGSWSTMRCARASSTSAPATQGRRRHDRRAPAGRRPARRAQSGAAARHRGPDGGPVPRADRRLRRHRHLGGEPALLAGLRQRRAEAGRRICADAGPVRAGLSAGPGACRPRSRSSTAAIAAEEGARPQPPAQNEFQSAAGRGAAARAAGRKAEGRVARQSVAQHPVQYPPARRRHEPPAL